LAFPPREQDNTHTLQNNDQRINKQQKHRCGWSIAIADSIADRLIFRKEISSNQLLPSRFQIVLFEVNLFVYKVRQWMQPRRSLVGPTAPLATVKMTKTMSLSTGLALEGKLSRMAEGTFLVSMASIAKSPSLEPTHRQRLLLSQARQRLYFARYHLRSVLMPLCPPQK
jgi:hypothetical protein